MSAPVAASGPSEFPVFIFLTALDNSAAIIFSDSLLSEKRIAAELSRAVKKI